MRKNWWGSCPTCTANRASNFRPASVEDVTQIQSFAGRVRECREAITEASRPAQVERRALDIAKFAGRYQFVIDGYKTQRADLEFVLRIKVKTEDRNPFDFINQRVELMA